MAIINGMRTKENLKIAHKTKGSFNKAMRMDARKRYQETGRSFVCKICGETRQVDICHIKSIEEFDASEKIFIINGSDNLVVLCPLHHRLFDQKNEFFEKITNTNFGMGIHLIIDFPVSKTQTEAKRIREIFKESIINHLRNDFQKYSIQSCWIDE